MNKNREDLMIKLFKELSDSDKISTLDFIMFLRHRSETDKRHKNSERDISLVWMIDFLINLPDEEFNKLKWLMEGMDLVTPLKSSRHVKKIKNKE